MLFDFLLLETYYDSSQSVQAYEDMARKYGVAAVRRAIEAGYIRCHRGGCNALRGAALFWLTDKGRVQAGKSLRVHLRS